MLFLLHHLLSPYDIPKSQTNTGIQQNSFSVNIVMFTPVYRKHFSSYFASQIFHIEAEVPYVVLVPRFIPLTNRFLLMYIHFAVLLYLFFLLQYHITYALCSIVCTIHDALFFVSVSTSLCICICFCWYAILLSSFPIEFF